MSDVLLVNPHYARRHGGGVIPPIGLCYLAGALLDAGASVELIDLAAEFPDYERGHDDANAHLVERLDAMAESPRLVGIGPLTTATLEPTEAIAMTCRQMLDARVVVGGPLCAAPGASAAVHRHIKCDGLVAGDGERPIVDLWRGVAPAHVPGYTTAGACDPAPWREPVLDALALPARHLLSKHYTASWRRSMTGALLTAAYLSRGCPYSCSFCAAPLASGRKVRRVSDARIAAELATCRSMGVKEIIFYDDCLFVRSPKLDERVDKFVDAIWTSGWGGTFQLELRCDAVVSMSSQTLTRLAAVGCRQINMGIEKGHAARLEAIRKRLTPEVAREATDRVVDAGIRAAGTFILGGPGEHAEDLLATVDFATSLDLDFAHFNPLAIYPGTALYSEVFGAADWAELCRDAEWAPFGDILWRDAELPLGDILSAVVGGYARFYDKTRLARVLARAPQPERPTIETSYWGLASRRAESWGRVEPSYLAERRR